MFRNIFDPHVFSVLTALKTVTILDLCVQYWSHYLNDTKDEFVNPKSHMLQIK